MQKKPLRILSIDDDLGCQIAAIRYFTLVGGHMVWTAEDGAEGLKKAAEFMPDVILLDLNMPDMSGLEVIEALDANTITRHIPVIMVTGGSLTDAQHADLKTKKNFIKLQEKPTSFDRLLLELEAAA